MIASKDILGTYVSQVVSVGLTFLTTILISKGLGAEGMGNYTLYINAVMISSIWLGFSLPSAVVYFTATENIKPEKLFINVIYISIIAVFLSYVILYILYYVNIIYIFLPNFINNNHLIFLFIFHFLLLLLNNICLSVLRGKSKFKLVNISTFFNALILFFLIFCNFYLYKKDNIVIAVYITILSVFTQFLFNLNFVIKNINIDTKSFNILGKKEFKIVFSYIFLIYIANAIQFISYKMDIWILNYYHGPAHTGVYSVASTFAQVLWLLPTAISTILFTVVSQKNIDEIRQTVVSFSRLVIYIGFIFGVFLYILLKFLVPILYDTEYVEVSFLVLLLNVGIIPFSLCILFGSIVAGLNKNILNLFSSSICLIVVLLFDFILIPKYSSTGAAIAKSTAYFASSIYCLYTLKARYSIDVLQGLNPLLVLNDLKIIYNKITNLKYGK